LACNLRVALGRIDGGVGLVRDNDNRSLLGIQQTGCLDTGSHYPGKAVETVELELDVNKAKKKETRRGAPTVVVWHSKRASSHFSLIYDASPANAFICIRPFPSGWDDYPRYKTALG
jgi:hypothetical protein